MKKLLAVLFVIAAVLSACQNEQFEQKPEWLSVKVNELIPDKDLCQLSTVTVYKFEGEYYYNIRGAFWSCAFCHLYDADGNIVEWDEETFNKFHEENKEIDEFPACE